MAVQCREKWMEIKLVVNFLILSKFINCLFYDVFANNPKWINERNKIRGHNSHVDVRNFLKLHPKKSFAKFRQKIVELKGLKIVNSFYISVLDKLEVYHNG